ncbi:MAG: hypothetical protein LAN71_06875 [Acidobacteriia bacterium]|nr:hypothetical protein [Terriglobia bacterium]
MICNVCGQEYGLAHSCAGVAPSMTQEEAAPFPDDFAPLYYLRLAFNIARWDDVSIRRASRDRNATFYSIFLWAVAALGVLLVTAVPQTLQILSSRHVPGPAMIIGVVVGIIVGLMIMGILTFIQLGLCHLIAKWFFDGRGTLLGVMRPLLLGWFVNVLILLPVVGMLAAAIAWTAVLMLVFEEVDGIGRLQAFLISAGINLCFLVLQYAMHSPH